MSERKEITKMLSLAVQKHINPNNDTRIYSARDRVGQYQKLRGQADKPYKEIKA